MALEFCVLGPVQVLRDSREVELGPGRRRTTLAALLVDVGRVVPLETVVARVWDADVPDKPTTSIHTYVSRLRTAMRGVDQDGREIPAPLLTEAPGYRLAVDPIAVDAVRFESLVADADEAVRAGLAEHARDLLDHGLHLWRGPAYLDVPSAFARAEAARLASVRSRAEELTVEIDLALGDRPNLVARLEAMVEAEPFRESLQAALILALYRDGRQADALRRYDAVRVLLADELGVDPGRELRELHVRILRHDPELDRRAPVPGPGSAHPMTADGTGAGAGEGAASRPDHRSAVPRLPAQLRMVGRDTELARLQEAVEQGWATGDPVTVAVVGEAGIGKSRLLEEIASWAAIRGAGVAWGRSWQHEGVPPLWSWIQLLRTVVAQVGDEVAAECLRGRAALVRTLVADLPGQADAGGPADGAMSIEQSQVRQFDAVVAFLENVAAHRPLLLVQEDMHWSDTASRRMVEYLVTHLDAPNIALVLSVRSPTDDGAGASDLLGVLARSGRAQRISLRGLTAADVTQYVHDRTLSLMDPTTANELVARTAGNPFFVGEIVRLLVTDADGDSEAATTSERSAQVPDSVREVILQRVRRLGDNERAVLQAAAVIGPTFALDLLEKVSGLTEDAVDEAVDVATAAGFFRSEQGRVGEHRFHHALAQQAIVDDIGPARRTRLHARTARALHARVGVDPLAHADDIVHHLTATGADDDLDAAVDLTVRMSDASTRRNNYTESETLLLRALDLVHRLVGPDAERREMAVLIRLNSLYDIAFGSALGAADRTRAERIRRRALTLARRSADERDLLTAVCGSWAAALSVADFASALSFGEEVALMGEASGSIAVRALSDLMLSQVHLQRGHLVAAEERLTAVVEALDSFDPGAWAALLPLPFESAWGWRAVTRVFAGRDEAADADLAILRESADRDDTFVASYLFGCAAVAESGRDRPADAFPMADRAVERAESAGMTAVTAYLAVLREWARVRMHPDTPLERLRIAMDAMGEGGAVVMRPFLRGRYADALLTAGDPDGAHTAIEAALAEVTFSGNEIGLPQLLELRARILRIRGDLPGAQADEVRAATVARTQRAPRSVRAGDIAGSADVNAPV